MTSSTASLTSTVANQLIADGKAAVEAELTRIEGDISAAVTKGKAEAATLATALAVKLDAHTAEAAMTSDLLARATGTVQAPPAAGSPAITLTAPTGLAKYWAAFKTWLSANGWKGYVILGLGVLVLHYMWEHKIII
jgi:hypothetical protein